MLKYKNLIIRNRILVSSPEEILGFFSNADMPLSIGLPVVGEDILECPLCEGEDESFLKRTGNKALSGEWIPGTDSRLLFSKRGDPVLIMLKPLPMCSCVLLLGDLDCSLSRACLKVEFRTTPDLGLKRPAEAISGVRNSGFGVSSLFSAALILSKISFSCFSSESKN